jgi:hypothetical protein
MAVNYRSLSSQQSSRQNLLQVLDRSSDVESGRFPDFCGSQGRLSSSGYTPCVSTLRPNSSRLLVLPVHRAHFWLSLGLSRAYQINAAYFPILSPERTSSTPLLGRFPTSLVKLAPCSAEDLFFCGFTPQIWF